MMTENEKLVDKQKVEALLADFDGDALVHQAAVSMENTITNLEKAMAQFALILSNATPVSEDPQDHEIVSE